MRSKALDLRGGGDGRAAGLVVCLLSVGLLALAPAAAHAAYQQAGCFAGTLPGLSESCKPIAEEKFGEEVQLGGVGGFAVNRSGAGGVPKGTVYAIGSRLGESEVAMFAPAPDGGLRFEEAWEAITKISEEAREGQGKAPYERCGPVLGLNGEGKVEHPCASRREGTYPAKVDVAVDQATGNVYAYDGSLNEAGRQRITEYAADGSHVIARFGEVAAVGKTVAETPAQLHYSGFRSEIAAGAGGAVYVYDVENGGSEYRRLAVYEPHEGDREDYEYAGEVLAGATAPRSSEPSFDDAGHLYTFSGTSSRAKIIEEYAPQAPSAYPGTHPAPICSYEFTKGGLDSMTVDPATGEVFFYSEKKAKKIYRLGPCDEATGKFTEISPEPEVIEYAPERSEVWALAFDPDRKLPARPAGVLYAGAPAPVPNIGVGEGGEKGQSALGYEFGRPKGPAKTLTVSKGGSGQGTVTSDPEGIECGSFCVQEFEEGSTVTLTAKATAGSTFAGWSGECESTSGSECKVTMSAARSVTASFEEEGGGGPTFHTLKVHVSGEGSVSADSGTISACTSAGGPACEGSYEEGAEVTLTETPAPGSLFAGWGTPQCDESTEETCTITIGSADEDVAASFEAEPVPGIPLEVSLEGTGSGTVTSSPGLISCNPFCEDEYEEGTQVTLTASPSPGSLFMAWRHCDSVNGRQCTMTMSKAKEVSAVFTTAHSLTVSKTEGSGPGKLQAYGGLTCLYGCASTSSLVKEGTAVTVKATPAKHFHLASWEGDCEGKGACELSMGEDHEVSALFEEDPKLSLSLTKAGGGQALIKTKPAGISCGYTCLGADASFYEGEALTVSWKLNKGTSELTWTKGAGTCTGSTEALEGSCTLSLGSATALLATLK